MGCESRDAGCESRHVGCESRDVGCEMRHADCRSRDAGCESRDAVCKMWVAGREMRLPNVEGLGNSLAYANGVSMAYLCNSFVLSGIDFIFGMVLV